MESSHPEVVAEMLVHAAAMMVVVSPDGKVRSARTGATKWQPRSASAQMTEAFPENDWGYTRLPRRTAAGLPTLCQRWASPTAQVCLVAI